MKYFLYIFFIICHNLSALDCEGEISQRYEIDGKIHDQQELSNVLINISFDQKYQLINFDTRNKLRINNEMNFPCEKKSTKIVCSKKATYKSDIGKYDPKTGAQYESTALTKYNMEIIYDKDKGHLNFNHLIESLVSNPKKIQSSEIAAGKFLCK